MPSLDPGLRTKIAIGTGTFVLGFLIGTFLLTIPTPTVKEVSKNDFGLTIKGLTRPGLAVLAFDEDDRYVTTVSSDLDGVFVFEGLAITTGTREMVLRVMDGGWRSSPPKLVSLTVEGSASDEPLATSTETMDDLPPPGIPPASTGTPRTKPADKTATTTTPSKGAAIQSITATASMTRLYPTQKTGETLRVSVKDDLDRPVDGALVKAVAHYPTGDVPYTLRGSDGSYNISFMLPPSTKPDVPVTMEVTVEFQGLTSTARAVFTPR